jgi:hypothetical protein
MKLQLVKRSYLITGLFVPLLVSGASRARHAAACSVVSPFTGNASDLVTVHVHLAVGGSAQGSIFDNGTIVVLNHPPKGKGQDRCGADPTLCVCAPGKWLYRMRGGKGEIRSGNEVGSGGLFFNQELTWRRLPGPLAISLYVSGSSWFGVHSGSVSSDEVSTKTGTDYYFDITSQEVPAPGGVVVYRTIQITQRK